MNYCFTIQQQRTARNRRKPQKPQKTARKKVCTNRPTAESKNKMYVSLDTTAICGFRAGFLFQKKFLISKFLIRKFLPLNNVNNLGTENYYLQKNYVQKKTRAETADCGCVETYIHFIF